MRAHDCGYSWLSWSLPWVLRMYTISYKIHKLHEKLDHTLGNETRKVIYNLYTPALFLAIIEMSTSSYMYAVADADDIRTGFL